MVFDRRLLQLARQQSGLFSLAIGLGATGGVLIIWQGRLFSRVVGAVFLQRRNILDLQALVWLMAGLILLRFILQWGQEASARAAAAHIQISLREKLVKHISELEPAGIQGHASGEWSHTLLDGVHALDPYFSQYLLQLALAVVVPLLIVVSVLWIDPLSGVILLLTGPLIPFFMQLIGEAARARSLQQWEAISRLSAFFLDVIQGLPTLKRLDQSQAQTGHLARAGEKFRQTTLQVLKISFLSALTLELLSTLSTALVAVQIGLRLLAGWVTFEQALFVLVITPEFYAPLRLLGQRFHAGMEGVSAWKTILPILNVRLPKESNSKFKIFSHYEAYSAEAISKSTEEIATTNNERWFRNDIVSSRWISLKSRLENARQKPNSVLEVTPKILCEAMREDGITIRELCYSYPGGEKVLDNLNLHLPSGEITVLTGSSGAGKSTLVQLLLGLLQPEDGQIFGGEIEQGQMGMDAWRSQIAWVPQKPYLFAGTIAENIRFARPQAGEDEIERAAQLANADEFILRLPQGYRTLIGEGGTLLSAGQLQRIALTRAILKDAPFLILDEGTAHLDSISRQAILDSLVKLKPNRITLIISHQPDIWQVADRILRLERGRICKIERAGVTDWIEQRNEKGIGDWEQGQDKGDREQGLGRSTEFFKTPPPNNFQAVLSAPESSPFATLEAIKTGWRLVGLARPLWKWMLLSAGLGFAAIGSGIGLLTTSAYIISLAALQPPIAFLQVAIVGVRFFGLSRGVFRYLERMASHSVTLGLLGRIRTWFYQAIEPLAPAGLSLYRSGDLLSRAISDINGLEGFYVRSLAPLITGGLVSLAICIYFGSYNLRLGLILALFFLAAGWLQPVLMRRLASKTGSQIGRLHAELQASLVAYLQGLAEILVFNRQVDMQADIYRQSWRYTWMEFRSGLLESLHSSLGSGLANLAMLAVLISGALLVSEARLSPIFLAGLALAALASFEAITPFPAAAQHLETHLQTGRRLFELADQKPAVVESVDGMRHEGNFGIELKQVDFAYPPRPLSFRGLERKLQAQDGDCSKVATLQGISLACPAGNRIGVVGPSGSGKSTLLNLLLRFWEVDAGEILVDGRLLQEIDLHWLRQTIAVSTPDDLLFNDSLADNLRLGKMDATTDEMLAVLTELGLQGLVKRLANGLDTRLGEHGGGLSGGEERRVAIARTLLRESRLFAFDEPGTHLDRETYECVLDVIFRRTAGKSLILISHDPKGMEAMDNIYVMENGKIVDQGTHEELVRRNRYYRKMG